MKVLATSVCAAAVLAAASSTAQAQFDHFDWSQSQPSLGSVSADVMFLASDDFDAVGTTRSWTTTAPVAGEVTALLYFGAHFRGCTGGAAAYIVGGNTVQITVCSGLVPLRFTVGAGQVFGFASVQTALQLAGYIKVYDFAFTPLPEESDVGGTSDQFGFSMDPIGDLNGDGVPDLAVGSPGADAPSTDTGALSILSGADLSVLVYRPGTTPGARFGHSVAGGGDFNNDGFPDVAIGAPAAAASSGTVIVLSGKDGSTLLVHSGSTGDESGFAVDIADATLDGVTDLLVGAPGDNAGGGAATLLSGSTGLPVFTWAGGAAGDRFGQAVAFVGDLNGNGGPEIAVGAPSAAAGSGALHVFVGATSAPLHLFSNAIAGARLGAAVTGMADVDGDGTRELAIGAPGTPSTASVNATGRVHVYSGANFAPVFALAPVAPALDHSNDFGFAIRDAGDVDGDGVGDLLIGAPDLTGTSGAAAGAIHVYSGRTGTRHLTKIAAPPEVLAGHSLAVLGDSNGDGVVTFAIGAPGAVSGPASSGRVTLNETFQSWDDAGAPLAGSAGPPQLIGHGYLLPGLPISMSLSGAAPLSSATWILGLSRLDAPFLGGVLVPFPDVVVTALPTTSAGTITLSGHWPVSGATSGFEFFTQFWIVDGAAPLGVSASNGLRGRMP